MGSRLLAESEPNTEATLEKLTVLAQKGDAEAVSQLIERTQDALYRFLFYLTADKQLSEDLFQETYVRALEKIHKVKDPARVTSWLFTTAKNLFLDHLRRGKRVQPYGEPEKLKRPEESPHGSSATVSLEVQQALSKMEPEGRLVLMLVDMEGHSYKEASKIIGISEAALRSRLHRLRELFVKNYEKS